MHAISLLTDRKHVPAPITPATTPVMIYTATVSLEERVEKAEHLRDWLVEDLRSAHR